MKPIALIFTLFSFLYFVAPDQSLPPAIDGPEVIHRMFFQVVEDDMRFTGCINPGGMCYSPEPSVVQDCQVGEQWVPCGWE